MTLPVKRIFRGAAVSDDDIALAKLCAEDLPDKVIAERLGVSQKTVEPRLCALRRKLGLRSKIGVAVWAVRQGHA